MGIRADRKFDWIAALSVTAGAAVMIPALAALAATLATVAIGLF